MTLLFLCDTSFSLQCLSPPKLKLNFMKERNNTQHIFKLSDYENYLSVPFLVVIFEYRISKENNK